MLDHDLDYQKSLLDDARSKLRPAKIVMRIFATFHFLLSLIAFALPPVGNLRLVVFTTFLIVGALFLLISFTMNKFPMTSSIAGLVLYILVIIFYALNTTLSGELIILILLLVISIPVGLWYLILSIKWAKRYIDQLKYVQLLEGSGGPMDMIK